MKAKSTRKYRKFKMLRISHTHFSFDLKSQEKKNTSKKKTAFSFIQSILLQKVKKMIFSGEKKNGTFE